jgi:sporulation protein YlmC with PRC-barrel domain
MRKQLAIAVSVLGLMAGGAFANDAKHADAGWVSSHKLLGESIYNAAGDDLGKVKDIVMTPAGGHVQAVIDVRDSDRDVAVAIDRLSARPGHKDELMLNTTKDQLKAMAAWDSDAAMPARAAAIDNSGSTRVAAADHITPTAAMPDRMSLEKMIGRTVITADGSKIGDVEDVVLDRGGKARQVVIDLDWSTDDVAFDFNRLSASAKDPDKLVLAGVTKAQMDSMPKWKYDADTVSLKHSK